MKKYKNNKEAAKAYADLAVSDPNSENLKLQHEAACLDFAAGANWKDGQLRLSFVSQRSELLLAYESWKETSDVAYGSHKHNIAEFLKANNYG